MRTHTDYIKAQNEDRQGRTEEIIKKRGDEDFMWVLGLRTICVPGQDICDRDKNSKYHY